jgi:uncharacterized Fe-S cluster protein YjdI
MERKTYRGPIVDVSDDREVCMHSAVCLNGMPSVFNTEVRPWVDPGAADTEELAAKLREVVAACPSGALRIVEHPEA